MLLCVRVFAGTDSVNTSKIDIGLLMMATLKGVLVYVNGLSLILISMNGHKYCTK